MKNYFLALIMMSALITVSCREPAAIDYFYPEESLMHFIETADFTISVSRDEPGLESGEEKLFRRKAEEKCFELTARKLMQLQPMLKGSYSRAGDEAVQFLRFKGDILPETAPLTGDLTQEFQCTLQVSPYLDLSGEIVALEEERTITATGDRITLMLFREHPVDLPAYFLIGRRTPGQDINLITLFGSGRITQIVDIIVPEDQTAGTALTMAQARILETRHEVGLNDLVFLAVVDVSTRKNQVQSEGFSPTPTGQEVWIRPEVRDDPAPMPEMK